MRLYTFLYTITIKMIDFVLRMKSTIEKKYKQGYEKRERNGIIMNHVLRKMTAFASALVMLGGSIVYGQFGGVFSTARISAEV